MSFRGVIFGLLLAGCAARPATLTPTMRGLTGEPGPSVAPAGPLSCVRVFTTPLPEKPPRPLSPEQSSLIEKPADLILQLGGSGRSAACSDWLREHTQPPSQAASQPVQPDPATSQPAPATPSSQPATQPVAPLPALWLGVMLGDTKGRAQLRSDFDTLELQDRVTIAQLSRDEGLQLRLKNPELRGETRAYLQLQAEAAPFQAQLDVLERNASEPITLRLHVIDTRWRRSFAWRAAVPFLLEGGRLIPGLSVEGLWYPARPFIAVDSWLLRELAFDVGAGATSAQDDPAARALLATFGVSWHEFISVGYAFDLSVGAPRAPYISFTLFSSRGVFGLIPYEEIRKALQITFSNRSQEAGK